MKPRIRRGVLAAAASLSMVSAAQAQSAADVEAFVKSSLSGTMTLARWHDGICPAAIGLSDRGDNARVTDRIRQIAAMVGAPVAPAPCTANIHIYFTADPQALFNGLRDRGGVGIFAAPPSQPIQAWYAIAGRDAHSGAAASDSVVAEFGSARIVSELAQVYIIVDVNQTKAHPLTAVADDAAMLSLSGMKPADGCQKLPSITNLDFSDCADGLRPDQASPADLAYLKGIYGEDPHRPLEYQRADIVMGMEKALAH